MVNEMGVRHSQDPSRDNIKAGVFFNKNYISFNFCKIVQNKTTIFT